MNIPTIYSEWVDCFEQFQQGMNDEEIVLAMEKGSIEWTAGVAERLTQCLCDVLNDRLKKSADQLQKELNYYNGDETVLVKAVLSARKRLAVLNRVAELQIFPEQVKKVMKNALHENAKHSQQSLEDSAVTDRTGRLRSLIRNNPITTFNQIENVFGTSIISAQYTSKADAPSPLMGQKSNRRRVILP